MPFACLIDYNWLRYTSQFLFLLMLVLLPADSSCLAASSGDKAVHAPTRQSEQQYKSAKDYYYKLERDPDIGRDRSNWLGGVRNFRRIYLADPKSNRAPSCLYMMARMYRRMYQQFKLPIDIDEAINYFNDIASIFPQSKLADDALFTIADIELTDKGNPAQAAKFYQKVIKQFPKGDKKAQAVSQLQELAKNHDIKLLDLTITSRDTNDLVKILPVQHWSSNSYTRVVIRASAPVNYSASLLEKNNNQPRRLFIDLKQSYIPPKFRSPVPIQDGLLKQVRPGQFNDTTARVILDIESLSDYKIFSLKDPFRIIVDVRGVKKEQVATAVAVEKPAARPVHKTKLPIIQPEIIASVKLKQEIFITLEDRKKVKPSITTAPEKLSPDMAGLSLAQQLGLGVRRIVIDPGHGGKDPGAMAFGLKEKDIVLNVARRTAEILEVKHNYEVLLTRDSDTFLSLEERTAIANTKNADLFVSIHVNAHPQKSAKGVETFYLNLATNAEAMRVAARENATSTHNISELQDILSDLMQNAKIKESSQLAEFVQTSLVTGLQKHKYNTKNLGVKQAPFYVLIGAEMPAVLAEISFITNPGEAKLLEDDNYLQSIAEQIAAGIVTFIEHRRTAALQL